MRALRIFGVAWVLFLGGGFEAARAGGQLPGSPLSTDPFVATFDENCIGSYRANGGPILPFACSIQPDPLNSGVLVPTFVLPEPVLAGDVLITDLGTSTLSDFLRFPDNGGGIATVMLYYSVVPNGSPLSASDVGIPTVFQPNQVSIDENLGGPGNDGFLYKAGGNTFRGISDSSAVPEPASSILLACGCVVLVVAHAKRRRLPSTSPRAN